MNQEGMIINPGRQKGEPELPAAGLLLLNPAEAETALHLAKGRGGRFYFLFNSRLVVIPATAATGAIFLAGPAVGAPMAVLSLEKLVALGARRIMIYGWCGSINRDLHIGDVLLPTWAVSSEGTSPHYPVDRRPESHAVVRQVLADRLSRRGLTVQTGPVWTTDAPYRESRRQIAQLAQEGILGVDMEYGALIAAAAFRKVQMTAVLLVSDELWSGTWRPGFRHREFKKKSRDMVRFLADFCAGLSASVSRDNE